MRSTHPRWHCFGGIFYHVVWFSAGGVPSKAVVMQRQNKRRGGRGGSLYNAAAMGAPSGCFVLCLCSINCDKACGRETLHPEKRISVCIYIHSHHASDLCKGANSLRLPSTAFALCYGYYSTYPSYSSRIRVGFHAVLQRERHIRKQKTNGCCLLIEEICVVSCS